MPRAKNRQGTLTLPIPLQDPELLAAAAEALCDQCLLDSSPQAYHLFLARLDRPAQPNERLRATMQTTPRWEI